MDLFFWGQVNSEHHTESWLPEATAETFSPRLDSLSVMISERSINSFLQSATMEGSFLYKSDNSAYDRLMNREPVALNTSSYANWMPELAEKFGENKAVLSEFQFYYPRIKISKN